MQGHSQAARQAVGGDVAAITAGLIMRCHPMSIPVQTWGAQTMATLTRIDQQRGGGAVREVGAVHLVLDAMEHHPASESVQAQCIQALLSMARADDPRHETAEA
jgi:hypothetical protein